VLQRDAVCCSVSMPRTPVTMSLPVTKSLSLSSLAISRALSVILSVLQYVAVCCSVLQCVAAWYSALQCVAVSRIVLQCVAMCCSVLHVFQSTNNKTKKTQTRTKT